MSENVPPAGPAASTHQNQHGSGLHYKCEPFLLADVGASFSDWWDSNFISEFLANPMPICKTFFFCNMFKYLIGVD